MGYSTDEGAVRLDRFKTSGKWYDTHSLNMAGLYNERFTKDAVMDAMIRQGIGLETGWTAVVVEPYHEHAHPIMVGSIELTERKIETRRLGVG